MRRSAGIDGCRAGWIVVTLTDGDTAGATASLVDGACDFPGAAITVIDMPIGLPDRQGEARATDAAARAFLRERNRRRHVSVGSRVFTPPSRAALEVFRTGATHAELNARIGAPRLSVQAYGITRRIDALDRWMTPERQRVTREGHPEIAFAVLTGETLAPKKTAAGKAERRAALIAAGFDPDALAAGLGSRRGGWGMDDLFDACVLAWVAERIAAGAYGVLPPEPATDSRGLRMEIVA